ncbi:MAG: type VI secretion system baseplate subunit TssK [Planctomycetota bacterium]
MTLLPEVHWSEGLFLRPHHLQMMQRGLRQSISAERMRSRPFAYGVAEAALSREALSNFEVRFDALRAVLPSGVEIDAPTRASVPALSIKEAMEQTGAASVLLGVPRWDRAKPNAEGGAGQPASGGSRPTAMYRVSRLPATDENTGVDEQEVDVRLVNAVLLLEGEQDPGLETMPLLRVKWSERADQPVPEQDPGYIPPCLSVGGSGNLERELRGIMSSLAGARGGLRDELTRGGYGVDKLSGRIADLQFRHTIVSGASARLKAMLGVGELTPFEFYVYLCEMVAELEALDPERESTDPPAYDHDDLARTFQLLRERAMMALNRSGRGGFIQRNFEQRAGNLVATLESGDAPQDAELYLMVDSAASLDEVRRALENRNAFKLIPGGWLGDPHKQMVFGVKLVYDPHPPELLPAPTRSMSYYRLDRTEPSSAAIWREIDKNQGGCEMAIMRVAPAVFECRAAICREVRDG